MQKTALMVWVGCLVRQQLHQVTAFQSQLVVVVDAELANQLLGAREALNKALEPSNSDQLFAQRFGHHTMFSSDTGSPYWRLIRKGTAPAFKAENIKCDAWLSLNCLSPFAQVGLILHS